ncbi:hypothetical protein [Aeromonas rivipollensis]|uniref:hypothetical protein n=1 Tax=Aeromonas rivipollensis TaxID=948519 RepID=UPI0027D94A20|nr:hypothetical protein [uncultured Aeromonas sp.]MDU1144138.1 hypothetical protein [Aeromonas hydrophila]
MPCWGPPSAATTSTWLAREIIHAFILPHAHWLLVTLLLIRTLGKGWSGSPLRP